MLVAAHGEMPEPGVLSGLSVPVIALDGFLGDETPTAGVDQLAGGVMATRHLLELGHRELAHIRGPEAWPQADARHAGFTEALAHAGLAPGPVVAGDWSPRAGYEGCLRILDEYPSTTALFVANDQMAMGALRALDEAGRRVPEDVVGRRLRRHPRGRVLAAAAHDDPAGLRRAGSRGGAPRRRGDRGARTLPSTLVPPRLVTRHSTARPPRGRRR